MMDVSPLFLRRDGYAVRIKFRLSQDLLGANCVRRMHKKDSVKSEGPPKSSSEDGPKGLR